jgi:MFS family permease
MDDKGSIHSKQIEDLDDEKGRPDYSLPPAMPALLAALSEVEHAKAMRRAMWKLDLRIMPCMVLMYIMNYLDRQNIAAAKLADIDQDLSMTDVQYQTCISILFVGYSMSWVQDTHIDLRLTVTFLVLMQVPSNLVVGKIKFPGVYICFSMALWGVLSACTAAVHNFPGLLASRFFLGFVEAVFFPGALFYMSLFYSKKQFALRTAILYSGSQLGNAFGGLFAVAILKLDGVHGLEGWRWVSAPMISKS